MAVILTLFSRHPRRNGPSFLAGWVLGLGVMIVLVLWLAEAGREVTAGASAEIAGGIKIVLGLFFIVFALLQWQLSDSPGVRRS